MMIPHFLKQKKNHHPHRHLIVFTKSAFWFAVGAFLGFFLLISFTFIYFQQMYTNVIYPGVLIQNIDFGGKSQNSVQEYFEEKNEKISDTKFVFVEGTSIATISAKNLDLGFDENLLAAQAYTIGRSNNILSNLYLILEAYLNGVQLPPVYRYDYKSLESFINPIAKSIYKEPVDALFTFQNGKVSAFRLSSDGQELDRKKLDTVLSSRILTAISSGKPTTIVLAVPIKTLKPHVSTGEVNNLGIKELLATGTSQFQGSIPSRIFNISLASSRLNGILVAPGEVFSFNKALGDISAFTGYKQAYVIQNGRTVLGDGGGVCQVSTTFFRAILNGGLPITERHAHAYRVAYYEQDSSPGFDATIYVPSVDLKFKNDTGNHILIQNVFDPDSQRLTFLLYGTKDSRETRISKATITSQTPAPTPLYQDDPTLPKGTVKQVDFSAPGASVYFTREVVKDGKVILSDKFVSNFRPWQAIYLRGTKE